MNEEANLKCWISLVMRSFLIALLIPSALFIFQMGLDSYAVAIQAYYQDSWFPVSLAGLFAKISPFIDIVLSVWIFLGICLKAAWIVCSFYFIVIAFLYSVFGHEGGAVHNFFYVFLCCVGLYVSSYDRWSLDGIKKIRAPENGRP